MLRGEPRDRKIKPKSTSLFMELELEKVQSERTRKEYQRVGESQEGTHPKILGSNVFDSGDIGLYHLPLLGWALHSYKCTQIF